MYKKILLVFIMLIVLTGCFKKEYEFTLNNDVVIVDQSKDEFSVKMLEDAVTLTYGEEVTDLENVLVAGEVDLSKIGTYPISLSVNNDDSKAKTQLTVSVVDRKDPTLHIFEKELLVYIDEEIEINSQYFLIDLTDGVNGVISDRIEVQGKYDLNKVGSYPVLIVGKDESGNEVSEDINIRVTDIFEEKAYYLYEKAIKVAKGEAYVFKNDDMDAEIVNLDNALSVFTPTHKSQLLWYSGVNGTYQPKQSGAKLTIKDNKYYADYSLFEQLKGYKTTSLELQQEVENYRHYLAKSTYEVNGEEEVYLTKFSVRKIDGVWLVDEFYLQY